MAGIAVFLYPDRVGFSRIKAAGYKPGFSTPIWKAIDNMEQLLNEPLLLASAIRELVGDEQKYDVYLTLWHGAYNALMFSHHKKRRRDMARLRQSELETVFRGEFAALHTYDLVLDKGRANAEGKIRRMIYVTQGSRIQLMVKTFAAQKLKLCRVAPIDAATAEAALHFWNPDKSAISAFLVMDAACSSMVFLKNGSIQAVRTLMDGFHAAMINHSEMAGTTPEASRQLWLNHGLEETTANNLLLLQDEAQRVIYKLCGEVVKNLHSVFGDDAVLNKVMLSGEFVNVPGMKEKVDQILETDCVLANPSTMSGAAADIVLDEKDFNSMFHLGAVTARGVDLMSMYKKTRADRRSAAVLCAVLGVASIALMSLLPLQKRSLEKEQEAAAALLEQPEYVTIRELHDSKLAIQREKNNLIEAIEALPHGQSKTSEILSTLQTITQNYGTLLASSVDYNGKTIHMTFTTLNYDSFVLWQKEMVATNRFSFITPPTYEGNGLIYTVRATLTSTDFDAPEAETEEVPETAAQEG